MTFIMGHTAFNIFRTTVRHLAANWSAYIEDNDSASWTNTTETDPYCKSLPTYPDAVLALKIYLYISIFLVTVGLIGNFINVLVMFTSMRKHTSSIYIVILAMSDSTFLILEFTAGLLPLLGCFHFTNPLNFRIIYNATSCKVVMFLYNLAANYSSLLILCFTIERFIAVYKPMKVKQLCTMKRTRTMCVVLLVIITVFIMPYNFLMIGIDNNSRKCTPYPKWFPQHSVINVVEFALFRVVPVFLIAVMNICIIYKVVKHVPVSEEPARNDRNRQLTLILILISTSYIVLYLPELVIAAFWMLLVLKNKVADYAKEMWIWHKYTQSLYTAAFAINFYLYVLGSRMYRENMKKTYFTIRRSFRSSSA